MSFCAAIWRLAFFAMLLLPSAVCSQTCVNIGGANPTTYSQDFNGLGDSSAPQNADPANIIVLNATAPRRYFGKWDNAIADNGTVVNVPGWAEVEEGTNTGSVSGRYGVGDGSAAGANTYSFASAASPFDRAFGSLNDDTEANNWLGGCFRNMTGRTIFAVRVGYTGEMWRHGGGASPDRLDFQYAVNATNIFAGTFIDFNSLDFPTPDLSGAAGPRDGNIAPNRTVFAPNSLPVTIADGSSLYLRWQDSNITGADDGLAVDNFQITFLTPSAALTSISGRAAVSNGRGIPGASLVAVGHDGKKHFAATNPFGYYRFADLEADEVYIISIFSKRYSFDEPVHVVQTSDNLTEVDFAGRLPE
jgi:hypothetical protein